MRKNLNILNGISSGIKRTYFKIMLIIIQTFSGVQNERLMSIQKCYLSL